VYVVPVPQCRGSGIHHAELKFSMMWVAHSSAADSARCGLLSVSHAQGECRDHARARRSPLASIQLRDSIQWPQSPSVACADCRWWPPARRRSTSTGLPTLDAGRRSRQCCCDGQDVHAVGPGVVQCGHAPVLHAAGGAWPAGWRCGRGAAARTEKAWRFARGSGPHRPGVRVKPGSR
jgi:hypothetical protein